MTEFLKKKDCSPQLAASLTDSVLNIRAVQLIEIQFRFRPPTIMKIQ